MADGDRPYHGAAKRRTSSSPAIMSRPERTSAVIIAVIRVDFRRAGRSCMAACGDEDAGVAGVKRRRVARGDGATAINAKNGVKPPADEVTFAIDAMEDCPWRLVLWAMRETGVADTAAYRRACLGGGRWSRAVRSFNKAVAAGAPPPPSRLHALVPLVHHPSGPRLQYLLEPPGELAELSTLPVASAASRDAAVAELARFPPVPHAVGVTLRGGNPGSVHPEYILLDDVRRALPRLFVAVLGHGPAECGGWRHPVKTVHDWVLLLAPSLSGRPNSYHVVRQDGERARALASAVWRAKPWRARLPPGVGAAPAPAPAPPPAADSDSDADSD